MKYLAVLLGLLTVSCVSYETLPPAHARVVQLIALRLALGKEVAWAKFHTGAPIHDPKRESQLLNSLVDAGAKLGVAEADVRQFFEAQMKASRALQQELLCQWKEGKSRPAHSAKNLTSEIRPQLNTVSCQMLVELRQPLDWTPEAIAQAATELQRMGYSTAVTTAAIGCLPK